MVDTGYISFITESGSTRDGDGNPVAPTYTVSAPVPCNIAVVTREYRVYTDGQYKQAQYSVTMEIRLLEAGYHGVRLYDGSMNVLGDFQVQNAEELRYAQTYKIIV